MRRTILVINIRQLEDLQKIVKRPGQKIDIQYLLGHVFIKYLVLHVSLREGNEEENPFGDRYN